MSTRTDTIDALLADEAGGELYPDEFTVEQYVARSVEKGANINASTARGRLIALVKAGKLTTRKVNIGNRIQINAYRPA